MKLSEMTQEQQVAKRKYDREAKQRSRAKERQEKERLAIPNARDYVMPEQQQKKLTEYSDQVAKTIQTDLGLEELARPDAYIVDAVACVTLGLENNFPQIVNNPEGMLVGGWFPDAAASETIEHVHRFPDLLNSPTFTELYKKFLQAVAKWAKRNEQYADREYIQELKQEIAGEYILPPPLPEPKPEPPKTTEQPLPSMAEILERGRIELLNRIQPESQSPHTRVHDPNIAPDARRYLDGTL